MGHELNDDTDLIVGVDIGGTKTALIVAGAASGVTHGNKKSAETDCEAGPDRMLATLYEAIDAALEEMGRSRKNLRAVGFAVPGMVTEEGHVIDAGKLTGWKDFDLRGRLERELGVPAFVEHDANAAALGEQWRGLGKDMRSFVFLALGTGIGAGLVLEGRLYRGARHAAGEVGNMVPGRAFFDLGAPEDHNLGGLIGGQAIRTRAEQLVGEPLSAAEALRRSLDDPRLEPLADQVADHVAIAVINIAALLDPEAIIFGGGTSSAGAALFDRVRERVREELPFRPRLLRSQLGEDAQLQGAIFGALRRIDSSARP